jgi:hypothetical protein
MIKPIKCNDIWFFSLHIQRNKKTKNLHVKATIEAPQTVTIAEDLQHSRAPTAHKHKHQQLVRSKVLQLLLLHFIKSSLARREFYKFVLNQVQEKLTFQSIWCLPQDVLNLSNQILFTDSGITIPVKTRGVQTTSKSDSSYQMQGRPQRNDALGHRCRQCVSGVDFEVSCCATINMLADAVEIFLYSE